MKECPHYVLHPWLAQKQQISSESAAYCPWQQMYQWV